MSPELRARVMQSIGGRAQPRERRKLPPLMASLRLVSMVVVLGVIALVFQIRAQRQQELDRARAALLLKVRQQASALTVSDRKLPERVNDAVKLHAQAAYVGDSLPQGLRGAGVLAELLALPTVYLRGSREVLSRDGGMAEAAASSWPDAFVLCLLDPPAARTEKELKAKARAAHARGGGMEVSAHVQRLAPVLEVLPLLSRSWQQRIAAAEAPVLHDYQRLYEAAPVQAAVKTTKARQLLLVMDEPGDAKTPAELDGERPHAVRVVLSDLTDGTLQLRFRHDVDPTALSATTRAEYASGVDSCTLALDLRKALGLGD